MANLDMDREAREANRKFYDNAANIYEKADGRRNAAMDRWMESRLKGLSIMAGNGLLLDVGCGTGMVLRNGKNFFNKTYGLDISVEILKKAQADGVICADCSKIPLKDNSVDVAVCFAVLHHIYKHEKMFQEIYRVLKRGGVLYIDHDMDKAFFKKFRPFIKAYRFFANPAQRYHKLKGDITKELYELSEVHSDGIASEQILSQLKNAGFLGPEVYYHWFGLNRVVNKFMKDRRCGKGAAPLTCIIVRK